MDTYLLKPLYTTLFGRMQEVDEEAAMWWAPTMMMNWFTIRINGY